MTQAILSAQVFQGAASMMESWAKGLNGLGTAWEKGHRAVAGEW